ncbi:uncharacterized protein LOC144664154 [Oculina patagonica]
MVKYDSPALDTPILWPVRRGANRISCQPLQKELQLRKTVQNVACSKCVARCHTEDNPDWDWIAGMKKTWHVETVNDSKYHLDQRGLLQIRHIAEADNGTRYRRTVEPSDGRSPDSVFIILLFDPEEDIPNTTKAAATSDGSTAPSVIPTKKTTATRKETTAPSVVPTEKTTATSTKTTAMF